MIAPVRTEKQIHETSKLQEAFLAMLPKIREHALFVLRGRPADVRQDLIQEVIAHCYVAFHRLVERGKADLAYPSVLAGFALRQIFSGRRVGSPLNTRDVLSRSVTVERLDRFDDQAGEWQEVLVEDKNAGPAETAAIRIDFREWLRALPCRDRRIAETLAMGERTNDVAEKFGLTAARVSQLRDAFARSWKQLQGELGGRVPHFADAS